MRCISFSVPCRGAQHGGRSIFGAIYTPFCRVKHSNPARPQQAPMPLSPTPPDGTCGEAARVPQSLMRPEPKRMSRISLRAAPSSSLKQYNARGAGSWRISCTAS